MAALIGHSIGHYTLERYSSKDGLIETYSARRPGLTENLARVLIIRPVWRIPADFDRFSQCFLRETKALVTLAHQNIVPIHDAGVRQADGLVYLVREEIVGDSLASFLRQDKSPLSLDQTLEIVSQMCAGIEHIHSQGFIQAELCPESVMRRQNGQILVANAGVAKALETALSWFPPASTGSLRASARRIEPYLAPEGWEGKAEWRSDLYALGAITYELLAGRAPFLGDASQLSTAHAYHEPPSLQLLNPQVTPALEAVVLKMLSKVPGERYPSATAFAQALRAEITPLLPTVIRLEESAARALAFAPTGKTLAAASYDKVIRLLDSETGEKMHMLKGHEGPVLCLAFSPDLRTLASGSGDKSIRLWDWRRGEILTTLSGHTGVVYSLAFHPKGRLLVSASGDSLIKLWEIHWGDSQQGGESDFSGVELSSLTAHSKSAVRTLTFSPDGHFLASGGDDHAVRLWDMASGAITGVFSGHNSPVFALAWSPLGNILASGSGDQTIRLWEIANDFSIIAVRTLSGHTGAVLGIAFSPDGRTLASVGADNTVRLWDMDSSTQIRGLSGHSSNVFSLAFTMDGEKLATSSDDKTIRLWRL